jgi:hypothetical protein
LAGLAADMIHLYAALVFWADKEHEQKFLSKLQALTGFGGSWYSLEAKETPHPIKLSSTGCSLTATYWTHLCSGFLSAQNEQEFVGQDSDKETLCFGTVTPRVFV